MDSSRLPTAFSIWVERVRWALVTRKVDSRRVVVSAANPTIANNDAHLSAALKCGRFRLMHAASDVAEWWGSLRSPPPYV
jgi:hypothetical protein